MSVYFKILSNKFIDNSSTRHCINRGSKSTIKEVVYVFIGGGGGGRVVVVIVVVVVVVVVVLV
jgi:hypothetical protein